MGLRLTISDSAIIAETRSPGLGREHRDDVSAAAGQVHDLQAADSDPVAQRQHVAGNVRAHDQRRARASAEARGQPGAVELHDALTFEGRAVGHRQRGTDRIRSGARQDAASRVLGRQGRDELGGVADDDGLARGLEACGIADPARRPRRIIASTTQPAPAPRRVSPTTIKIRACRPRWASGGRTGRIGISVGASQGSKGGSAHARRRVTPWSSDIPSETGSPGPVTRPDNDQRW